MALAKKFEMLVCQDERFEVCNDVRLGLVCFRMRVDDIYNQKLLARNNHSAKMHMTPSNVNGKYTIRFCVTYEHATEKDIVEAWSDIKSLAEGILRDANCYMSPISSNLMKRMKFQIYYSKIRAQN